MEFQISERGGTHGTVDNSMSLNVGMLAVEPVWPLPSFQNDQMPAGNKYMVLMSCPNQISCTLAARRWHPCEFLKQSTPGLSTIS